jgi:hypothetical protein
MPFIATNLAAVPIDQIALVRLPRAAPLTWQPCTLEIDWIRSQDAQFSLAGSTSGGPPKGLKIDWVVSSECCIAPAKFALGLLQVSSIPLRPLSFKMEAQPGSFQVGKLVVR